MKKTLFLLVVVMATGCGESQLDRRAELETEENAGDSAPANEEIEASEEAVVSPKETPKTPQAKLRTGDGKGQARPSQQGRRPGGSNRRNPYASLGLSEEQQKKIDAIQSARREESRKVHTPALHELSEQASYALLPPPLQIYQLLSLKHFLV